MRLITMIKGVQAMQIIGLLVLMGTLVFSAALQTPAALELTAAFNNSGKIYLTSFDGELIQLTDDSTSNTMPIWSADGRQLAFLSEPSAQPTGRLHLMVMDVDTGEMRQVSSLAVDTEAALAWSPDGAQIAITWGALYVVEVATGDTRQITVDGIGAQSPTWSPDSSQIAFNANAEVYVVYADGHETKKLTQAVFSSSSYQPQWSTSTNRLLFVTNTQTEVSINIYDPETETTRKILGVTNNPFLKPMWSPDGSKIAVMAAGDPNTNLPIEDTFDVYVMNADGSDLQAVSGEGGDSLIGWTNNNQQVIFESQELGGVMVTYFSVNVEDGTTTTLSDAALDRLAVEQGIHQNMTVRPG